MHDSLKFHTHLLMFSEIEQVKRSLACKRGDRSYVPLHVLKKRGSLTVSDVCGGTWCEVQVEYGHLHPWLRHSREWRKRSAQGKPVKRKTKSMIEGAFLHLNKGILVHTHKVFIELTIMALWYPK